jgi:hypothetical protein
MHRHTTWARANSLFIYLSANPKQSVLLFTTSYKKIVIFLKRLCVMTHRQQIMLVSQCFDRQSTGHGLGVGLVWYNSEHRRPAWCPLDPSVDLSRGYICAL